MFRRFLSRNRQNEESFRQYFGNENFRIAPNWRLFQAHLGRCLGWSCGLVLLDHYYIAPELIDSNQSG